MVYSLVAAYRLWVFSLTLLILAFAAAYVKIPWMYTDTELNLFLSLSILILCHIADLSTSTFVNILELAVRAHDFFSADLLLSYEFRQPG